MKTQAQCRHCGRQIVPRLVIYRGMATHSLCPYCGGLHQQFVKGAGCLRVLFFLGFSAAVLLGCDWLTNHHSSQIEAVAEPVSGPVNDLVPRIDLRSKGN